jgi:hypothetical protein
VLHFDIELEEVDWKESQVKRKISGILEGLSFTRNEKRALSNLIHAIIRGFINIIVLHKKENTPNPRLQPTWPSARS